MRLRRSRQRIKVLMGFYDDLNCEGADLDTRDLC